MMDPLSKSHSAVLRDFLRGYLHEDWKEEYGSVEQAVRQFCKDSDPNERTRLRADWLAFTKELENEPLPVIHRRLRDLGSAWQPSQASDLGAITRALQRYPSD